MEKTNQYLPKENEILEFFNVHTGSYSSIRITELLIQGKVNHTTPHDAEWQHVRGVLFSLKSRGFVELKNEGSQVIEEQFYSTPDKIERYNNPNINKTEDNQITKLQKEIPESIMRQVAVIVISALILSILAYLVYTFTGIHLTL